MTDQLITFLQGISATAAWASGMIFFRYWRQSHDRLFAFFAPAFWLLAASWILLAVFAPTEEGRSFVYSVRLLAFALLITGMVLKNRRHA